MRHAPEGVPLFYAAIFLVWHWVKSIALLKSALAFPMRNLIL